MIEHGAKNLIFANRSGSAQEDAKDIVQTLQDKSANAAIYPCDVCESAQIDYIIRKTDSRGL